MTHLLHVYWLFLKIGLFTFGGGYAMIPLFQTELVDKYQYISNADFANIVAIAQMTPGPVGLNAATYIGYQQGVIALGDVIGIYPAGCLGALVGTLGVMTPSLTLVLAAAVFLSAFQENKYVKAVLSGILKDKFCSQYAENISRCFVNQVHVKRTFYSLSFAFACYTLQSGVV